MGAEKDRCRDREIDKGKRDRKERREERGTEKEKARVRATEWKEINREQ